MLTLKQEKEFDKIISHIGICSKDAKTFLYRLMDASVQVDKLNKLGGFEWLTNTFTSVVELIIAADQLYRELEDDDKGIDPELVQAIQVPWGLSTLVWRLNTILTLIVSAMEENNKAKTLLKEMNVGTDIYL